MRYVMTPEATTTTATDTGIILTDYLYVYPSCRVVPNLCCLRWAKAYRDVVRAASGWSSLADDWDSPEDHAAYDDCNCGRRAFECGGD